MEAEKRLKLKPEECVVFEDSIAGIKAAKLAGAKVIALTTTVSKTNLKKHNPDLIIKDFSEITISKLKAL